MDAAYSHAACALLTCTAPGRLVRSNVTLRRWTGWPDDRPPAFLNDLFTPASLLFFEMQLRPLLALGRPVEGAFLTLRQQDGTPLPVLLNAHQSSSAGELEMALILVREREQYEASLRQSHAEAERALEAMAANVRVQKMQAVGQVAGGIAHEFNNLLAIVRGNLVFAQQAVRQAMPLDRTIGPDLQGALEASDRATAIIRQLLAFTGREVFRRSELDVNRIVLDAAPLLVPALGRDVTWQTRLADQVWPILAATDQLLHVLTSLVLNARDAVRARNVPGLVRVTTGNVPGSDGVGDMVQLTVEDSGTGMTDEVRARAFDPFFTTKGVGQGTGLGLSMVYGTVDALGGRTIIASTPGEGTRVTLLLPRLTDAPSAARRD